MAQTTLAVLSHPHFPQVFTRAIEHEVTRGLATCCYETPESRGGACDAVPCKQSATVHHLESEQQYCLDHFRKVNQ